jgi:hypothetical protein
VLLGADQAVAVGHHKQAEGLTSPITVRALTRSSVPAPTRSLSPDRGVEGRAQASARRGRARRPPR